MIEYTRTNTLAKELVKKHEGDAGYDLYPIVEMDVGPGETVKISTGIVMKKCPGNVVGLLKERSGLALKKSIRIGGGVIDSNYRGEICVILQNLGRDTFEVRMTQAVAQLVFLKLDDGIIEVHEGNTEVSSRGENGFGSTDAK